LKQSEEKGGGNMTTAPTKKPKYGLSVNFSSQVANEMLKNINIIKNHCCPIKKRFAFNLPFTCRPYGTFYFR
jgi:hypothetical protein